MARELARPVTVAEVLPAAADALAGVFDLELYAGGRSPASTTSA
jgi:hypothetical protein